MRVNIDSGNVAAFFDLDHTISEVDTFRVFLKQYYAMSPLRVHYAMIIFIYGLLRKLRVISLQTFKRIGLIGLKNLSTNDIELLGKELFEHSLKKTIRVKAIEQIALHKKHGDLVYIVSASPDVYVKAFSDYLDCNGYFCTELEYHDGVFTGEIRGVDCIGYEKRNRVSEIASLENIEMSKSYAYSDHDSDIPLLATVGNPVAISPTESLRHAAVSSNWPIRHW